VRPRSGIDAARGAAVTLLLWGATIGCPRPAAAFWPIDRPIVAPVDSAAEAKTARRWQIFSAGPAARGARAAADSIAGRAAADSVAVGAAADSAPAAAAAADSLAAPPSAATLAAAAAALAGAAVADTTAAVTDSIGAAPASAVAGGAPASPTAGLNPVMAALANKAMMARGWAPEFVSRFLSTNDNLTGSVDLRSTLTDPSGVVLSNNIGYEESYNQLRNDQSETRRLTNALLIPLRGQGLTLNVTTANSRAEIGGRAVTAAASALRTNSDTRSGQASVKVSQRLDRSALLDPMDVVVRGLGVNAFYGYDVSGSRTDRTTTSRAGSSSNRRRGIGKSYGAGITFDRFAWMSVSARLGRLRRTNDDTIQQFVTADSLTRLDSESESEGDTTSVDVTMPAVGPVQSVTLGFRTSRGDETRPENATGSSGQTVSTGFQFETTSFYSRAFNATVKVQPVTRLNTTVTVGVARDSTSYRLKRQAFTDTRRHNWRLDNRLSFWKGTTLAVIYESSYADINRDVIIDTLGLVTNPQTHSDEQRRLRTEIAKAVTTTMNVQVYGEVKLDQGFYKHPTNQGLSDLDQFRTELGIVVTGAIKTGTTGGVTAYLRTYDQAFIDARQSARSKDETEYVVRPIYTWAVNERIVVKQNFGLESKVLDDIFNPRNSTLNRKHYVTTAVSYAPRPRLTLDAAHDYLLQDSGKYTTVTGREGRFFALEQRSKRDQITVSAHVKLITADKLVFTSTQTTNRIRTSRPNTRQTITEQGTLRLGFTSKLQVGELKLDSRVFRLQNFNAGLDRDVFYNADATLTWTF
jgi:hypothetical protein